MHPSGWKQHVSLSVSKDSSPPGPWVPGCCNHKANGHRHTQHAPLLSAPALDEQCVTPTGSPCPALCRQPHPSITSCIPSWKTSFSHLAHNFCLLSLWAGLCTNFISLLLKALQCSHYYILVIFFLISTFLPRCTAITENTIIWRRPKIICRTAGKPSLQTNIVSLSRTRGCLLSVMSWSTICFLPFSHFQTCTENLILIPTFSCSIIS